MRGFDTFPRKALISSRTMLGSILVVSFGTYGDLMGILAVLTEMTISRCFAGFEANPLIFSREEPQIDTSFEGFGRV